MYESKHGSTLRGIRENLQYLQELGITCIYMTPIFAANCWHKYDSVDYFEINLCFGPKEEFRKQVDNCHEKGIRMILDGVFNHCGSSFFAFHDLLKNGENSRYRDWFHVKEFPVKGGPSPNYEYFAYVDSMPKLNTGNPELQSIFWMLVPTGFVSLISTVGVWIWPMKSIITSAGNTAMRFVRLKRMRC